jgi:hypothetical protein
LIGRGISLSFGMGWAKSQHCRRCVVTCAVRSEAPQPAGVWCGHAFGGVTNTTQVGHWGDTHTETYAWSGHARPVAGVWVAGKHNTTTTRLLLHVGPWASSSQPLRTPHPLLAPPCVHPPPGPGYQRAPLFGHLQVATH